MKTWYWCIVLPCDCVIMSLWHMISDSQSSDTWHIKHRPLTHDTSNTYFSHMTYQTKTSDTRHTKHILLTHDTSNTYLSHMTHHTQTSDTWHIKHCTPIYCFFKEGAYMCVFMDCCWLCVHVVMEQFVENKLHSGLYPEPFIRAPSGRKSNHFMTKRITIHS